MNLLKSIFLIFSLVILCVHGRPQSVNEIAAGVKYNEEKYYNSGAPNLTPYNNPKDIDNAREEHEGYGSKIDSIYDGLHKKTSTVFNPKPVVDGLKEAEKYGNNGDHLSGLNSIVVGVMSALSNLLNKVVDAPVNVATTIVSSANKVLNQIGGKVVGLQK